MNGHMVKLSAPSISFLQITGDPKLWNQASKRNEGCKNCKARCKTAFIHYWHDCIFIENPKESTEVLTKTNKWIWQNWKQLPHSKKEGQGENFKLQVKYSNKREIRDIQLGRNLWKFWSSQEEHQGSLDYSLTTTKMVSDLLPLFISFSMLVSESAFEFFVCFGLCEYELYSRDS